MRRQSKKGLCEEEEEGALHMILLSPGRQIWTGAWKGGQFSYLTQDNEVDEQDRWSRKRRMMTESSGFVISPVGDQILAARHQIQYNTNTNTLQV